MSCCTPHSSTLLLGTPKMWLSPTPTLFLCPRFLDWPSVCVFASLKSETALGMSLVAWSMFWVRAFATPLWYGCFSVMPKTWASGLNPAASQL